MEPKGSGGEPRPISTAREPDELLTVVQAAEEAGVPVSTIRRAMDSGQLHFEVLRKGEREVQRIRWVDLEGLLATQEKPVPSDPEGISPRPEVANAGDLIGPGEPNSTGLQWLQEQQTELREQCFHLRHRLTQAELERNRALEALIQMQERVLVLQNQGHPTGLRDLWKRPGTWIAALSLCLLGLWIRGSVGDLESTVLAGQERWAQEMEARGQERMAFHANRTAGERRGLAERLDRWEQEQVQERQQRKASLEAGRLEDADWRRRVNASLETQHAQHSQETRSIKQVLRKSLEGMGQTHNLEKQRLKEEWTRELSLGMQNLQDQLDGSARAQQAWQTKQAEEWSRREQRAMEANRALLAEIESLKALAPAKPGDATGAADPKAAAPKAATPRGTPKEASYPAPLEPWRTLLKSLLRSLLGTL